MRGIPMASKKNRSRKSLAVALAIVGVAGLSMASAAQLTVTSDEVVAGVDTFAGCDTAVDVSYTTTYSAAAQAFLVDDVVVDNVDAACAGLTMTVEVLGVGAGFAVLEEMSQGAVAGTNTVPVVGTIDIADVYGVAVEIG
jgi:hypothetical protein